MMDIVYPDADHLLLQQAREGGEEAFNTLYKRYWKFVYSAAFKRLKDHAHAQDVTQDIFAALWTKREELQINSLEAYLYTAVRNKVLNLFEKEKRYLPFEQLLYHNIQLYGEQADAKALRDEFLQAYHALVDSLPEKRKKIFHFYYEEGLTTEDIACELQLSRKTVQNQLGRAVAFLKTNLSQLISLLMIFWL